MPEPAIGLRVEHLAPRQPHGPPPACCVPDPPPEMLSPTRTSEAHLAVRFGDAGQGWVILLDGEDVTNDCFELVAGDTGWVALFLCEPGSPSLKLLHRMDHVAHVVRHGRVQAVRQPRSGGLSADLQQREGRACASVSASKGRIYPKAHPPTNPGGSRL